MPRWSWSSIPSDVLCNAAIENLYPRAKFKSELQEIRHDGWVLHLQIHWGHVRLPAVPLRQQYLRQPWSPGLQGEIIHSSLLPHHQHFYFSISAGVWVRDTTVTEDTTATLQVSQSLSVGVCEECFYQISDWKTRKLLRTLLFWKIY